MGMPCRTFQDDELDILANKEIIAINQDPLGIPGDIVWKEGAEEVPFIKSLVVYGSF